MDTSISLKTTSQDAKKNTTTLTNVNPNASNSTLLQYAKKMASLSSDTYTGADKIEKTNLDEQGTKIERTLSLIKYQDGEVVETVTPAVISNIQGVDGWGIKPSGYSPTLVSSVAFDSTSFACEPTGNDQTEQLVNFFLVGNSPVTGSGAMTIRTAEDDMYQAAELIVTLQGGV